MTSAHSDGIILGLLLGLIVSIKNAGIVGSADGTGDGSGVGLQSILSWGSRHSSGQQLQATPIGIGIFRQMVLPMDAQLAGLSLGSLSQQAGGHWSIRWLHEVGMELGSGDGPGEGTTDGPGDGTGDGPSVGFEVGSPEGIDDGFDDGSGDGSGVGLQLIRSSGFTH